MATQGYEGRRTKTKLKCPRCGQNEMARISRRGFWEERILPLFGRYPWQCAICGEERMLRRRGATIRKAEPGLGDAAESGEASVERAPGF